MKRIILIIVAVVVAGFFLLLSPFIYEGVRSGLQSRSLEHRKDHARIATDCAALMHGITDDVNSILIRPTDPRVTPFLRSLAPRYIAISSNHVTMEFHGGFNHYGFSLKRSDTNANVGIFFFYTEQRNLPLTTIPLN